MSPGTPSWTGSAQRFPRVSGDEPRDAQTRANVEAFSPRERG